MAAQSYKNKSSEGRTIRPMACDSRTAVKRRPRLILSSLQLQPTQLGTTTIVRITPIEPGSALESKHSTLCFHGTQQMSSGGKETTTVEIQ